MEMKIDTSKLKWRHKWSAFAAVWVFAFYVLTGVSEMSIRREAFWVVIMALAFMGLLFNLMFQKLENGGWYGDDKKADSE